MESFMVPVIVVAALLIPVIAILAPVALVLGVGWLLVRSQRGRRGVEEQRLRAEAQLMQEIHEGLNRLDRRIESLETIVIDGRARREEAEDATRPF